MKVIAVSSFKGGTGVTTTACALALQTAYRNSDSRVLLLDAVKAPKRSCDAILNANPTSFVERYTQITNNLDYAYSEFTRSKTASYVNDLRQYDFIVVDAGDTPWKGNATNLSVVRNDYLSLRSFANATRGKAHMIDAVVGIIHDGFALTANDVKAVTNKIVAEIPFTSTIARSVDAGMFVNRAVDLYEDTNLYEISSVAVRVSL